MSSEDASVTPTGASKEPAAGARDKRKADPIARALRVAYDEALREDVPDDFLDLLGKLD